VPTCPEPDCPDDKDDQTGNAQSEADTVGDAIGNDLPGCARCQAGVNFICQFALLNFSENID